MGKGPSMAMPRDDDARMWSLYTFEGDDHPQHSRLLVAAVGVVAVTSAVVACHRAAQRRDPAPVFVVVDPWTGPSQQVPNVGFSPKPEEALLKKGAPDNSPFFTPPTAWCSPGASLVRSRPGFPSYCDYYDSRDGRRGASIRVSYDGRSIILNGSRALFLSGSIHGPRAGGNATWAKILDLAVEHGLNMVQVYVFWNAHQPYADESTIFSGNLDFTALIAACASRGLFVTLRVGPYVCAEWSYGGIPAWLGLRHPEMKFRTDDPAWLAAMANWTRLVVDRTRDKGLWASQGGPVVLAQIENELSIDDDPEGGARYVAWCGELAVSLEPSVPWLMCNGESSNLTVNTYNGQDGADFLSTNGQNGRVLIDQPALWTENEGGYQVWGESDAHPEDYFWGTSSAALARASLRWVARGGSHLNYYMWAGGSNLGPWAAAGITQAYAFDAPLCANFEKHQPKFDHLAEMHVALASVADLLLNASVPTPVSPSLLNNNTVRAFVYNETGSSSSSSDDDAATVAVAFVENDSQETAVAVDVRMCRDVKVSPTSSVVLSLPDCAVLFDSSKIAASAMSYTRRDVVVRENLGPWTQFDIDLEDAPTGVFTEADRPIEFSALAEASGPSEQYAQYRWTASEQDNELVFLEENEENEVVVETEKASGVLLFVDGAFKAHAFERSHAEGRVNLTLRFRSGATTEAQRAPSTKNATATTLDLVYENLGYHNLVGRWGASRAPKPKGIYGAWLNGVSLVPGRWLSAPGLRSNGRPSSSSSRAAQTHTTPCVWSVADFALDDGLVDGPGALVLDLGSLGRGHLTLNGHDLGRFWNITRGDDDPSRRTQRYYHLPADFLVRSSSSKPQLERTDDTTQNYNRLVIFDALGGDPGDVTLLHTRLEESPTPVLEDVVDSPASCLE